MYALSPISDRNNKSLQILFLLRRFWMVNYSYPTAANNMRVLVWRFGIVKMMLDTLDLQPSILYCIKLE